MAGRNSGVGGNAPRPARAESSGSCGRRAPRETTGTRLERDKGWCVHQERGDVRELFLFGVLTDAIDVKGDLRRGRGCDARKLVGEEPALRIDLGKKMAFMIVVRRGINPNPFLF